MTSWMRGLTRDQIRRAMQNPILPERTLSIRIRASDTKCLSWWTDSRKRCPWLISTLNGSLHCGLFAVELQESLRYYRCIAAEVKS